MGFRIKELRKEREWTQEHLASLIGCTKGHVSEMEKGKKNPSTPMMQALARAFGVPVTDLYDDPGTNPLVDALAQRFEMLDEQRRRQALEYLDFLLSQQGPSSAS